MRVRDGVHLGEEFGGSLVEDIEVLANPKPAMAAADYYLLLSGQSSVRQFRVPYRVGACMMDGTIILLVDVVVAGEIVTPHVDVEGNVPPEVLPIPPAGSRGDELSLGPHGSPKRPQTYVLVWCARS